MRGESILEAEKQGDNLDLTAVLREVRSQGATDEDIRDWWNIPDTQHDEIQQEDDDFRNEAYKQSLADGLSEAEALKKLRKSFPIYEQYSPGGLHIDNDSNLPYELSPRVSRFFNSSEVTEKYKKEIEKASSINAFIRTQIKKKLI